jgi:hypothetical protein
VGIEILRDADLHHHPPPRPIITIREAPVINAPKYRVEMKQLL